MGAGFVFLLPCGPDYHPVEFPLSRLNAALLEAAAPGCYCSRARCCSGTCALGNAGTVHSGPATSQGAGAPGSHDRRSSSDAVTSPTRADTATAR